VSGHRSRRVADVIREELARLLREEIRDPRIGFVTLTGVDLSPDLRHARVYVSILKDNRAEALRALQRASSFLRRHLARSAGLRFTPELRFVEDQSLDTGFRVEDILQELQPGQSTAESDGTDEPAEPSGEQEPGGEDS
jgi:ribosome-binding factor A